MTKAKIEQLRKIYQDACEAYVRAFEVKQGLRFIDWAEHCMIADFGTTIFVSMDDIRFDVDQNIKAGVILEYCEDSLHIHNEGSSELIPYRAYLTQHGLLL